jgi:fatty-acyl-CoA synthase
MLEHAQARVLFTDCEFSATVAQALSRLATKPLVIDVDDPAFRGGERLGETDYETFLARGDGSGVRSAPDDEWDAIALNYTSGTTGNPKGVVYHHRGAYLNAICNALVWNMPRHAVYLWTLPMFHCNGWCFPQSRWRRRSRSRIALRTVLSGSWPVVLLKRTQNRGAKSAVGGVCHAARVRPIFSPP